VDALFALAFDPAVVHEAIEPCAGLTIVGVLISRETAVQDSHTPEGIMSMMWASVLRAFMRCGSLQARSVNLRNVGMRELLRLRTVVLMKPSCRRTDRR
jgi:hypothetical protein